MQSQNEISKKTNKFCTENRKLFSKKKKKNIFETQNFKQNLAQKQSKAKNRNKNNITKNKIAKKNFQTQKCKFSIVCLCAGLATVTAALTMTTTKSTAGNNSSERLPQEQQLPATDNSQATTNSTTITTTTTTIFTTILKIITCASLPFLLP